MRGEDKLLIIVMVVLSAFFAMATFVYLGYVFAEWIRT